MNLKCTAIYKINRNSSISIESEMKKFRIFAAITKSANINVILFYEKNSDHFNNDVMSSIKPLAHLCRAQQLN